MKAASLIGSDGMKFIMKGGSIDLDPDRHIEFTSTHISADLDFQFGNNAYVSLNHDVKSPVGVQVSYYGISDEDYPLGLGALLSFILENKVLLGLAVLPPEEDEDTSNMDTEERARYDRKERSKVEPMKIEAPEGIESPWVDYLVHAKISGKTYRVALRGLEDGSSYCSCRDFKNNALGACKHIYKVRKYVKKRFNRQAIGQAFVPSQILCHLKYLGQRKLHLEFPPKFRVPKGVEELSKMGVSEGAEIRELLNYLTHLENFEEEVIITEDAEEFIQRHLHQERVDALTDEIQSDSENHPYRTELLRVKLLPYQLEGIAFAVKAGRSVIADEMGLGKTIQAIGVAELLKEIYGISKVLVVTPASLKSQWVSEIKKFTDSTAQTVNGSSEERPLLYRTGAFFTICNYEQVLRDYLDIENVDWDLIILDEAQRIKNWEAKTSQVIKSLYSKFALALTGTPIENKLDDLYSILQFVDESRLPPAYQFFEKHRLLNDFGKTVGFRNLGEVRKMIAPFLLRRTKKTVDLQLPERTNHIVYVKPTDEQAAIHITAKRQLNYLVEKKYLTEMDIIRMQQLLLRCRMVANSTFLVNKENPAYSTKLERLEELLEELFAQGDRKCVLFSEWTTMLDLIEVKLQERNLSFVRLDGSVPQKKRKQLVNHFEDNPDCKFFISTNSGSTGLNLQSANTIINVDLPWNPAVLEQRIARAHRMGQKRKVDVYILVTEDTIEHSLLGTLALKQELANAALDFEVEEDEVRMESGIEALKKKLEILLGALPEGHDDQSVENRERMVATRLNEAQRANLAQASGSLLAASMNFVSAMTPLDEEKKGKADQLAKNMEENFSQLIEKGEDGKLNLNLKFDNQEAISQMLQAMANFQVLSQSIAESGGQ